MFWTAVLVLWKFSILVAFVASKAADNGYSIYHLFGTDKAPNALCCA